MKNSIALWMYLAALLLSGCTGQSSLLADAGVSAADQLVARDQRQDRAPSDTLSKKSDTAPLKPDAFASSTIANCPDLIACYNECADKTCIEDCADQASIDHVKTAQNMYACGQKYCLSSHENTPARCIVDPSSGELRDAPSRPTGDCMVCLNHALAKAVGTLCTDPGDPACNPKECAATVDACYR